MASSSSSQVKRRTEDVQDPKNTETPTEQLARILKAMKASNAYMPERPGTCQLALAKNATVTTNHVTLTPNPKVDLHMCSISISERERPKKTDAGGRGKRPTTLGPWKSSKVAGNRRKQIIALWLEANSEIAAYCVTDFKATLITCKVLPKDTRNDTILYRGEEETEVPRHPISYKIEITHKTTFLAQDIADFISNSAFYLDQNRGELIMQAFNIWLHHSALSSFPNVYTIGAHRAFPSQQDGGVQPDEHGKWLTFRAGYFSSVRKGDYQSLQLQGNPVPLSLLVNIGATCAAIWKPQALKYTWDQMNTSDGYGNGEREARMIGLRVTTKHLKSGRGNLTKRRWKICGFAHLDDGAGETVQTANGQVKAYMIKGDFASAHDVAFWWNPNEEDGAPGRPAKHYSIYEYMDRIGAGYNHEGLPVVNVGTKQRPQYLPMELCDILPGQHYRHKLDPVQQPKLLNKGKMVPRIQMGHVEAGCTTVGLCTNNPRVATFGISHSSQIVNNRWALRLMTVDGKQLKRPTLIFGAGKKKVTQVKAMWDLKLTTFVRPVVDVKLSLLVVTGNMTAALKDLCTRAVASLEGQLTKIHGISVRPETPQSQRTKQFCPSAQVGGVTTWFRENQKQNELELLLVILASPDSLVYGDVKRAAETGTGRALPTVCVLREKLHDRLKSGVPQSQIQSYFSNVALKINLKLGGLNHRVDLPTNDSNLEVLRTPGIMVVGLDVSHPPSDAAPATSKSFAAMTFSIEGTFSQWPAIVRCQAEAKQEMVDDIKNMFSECLEQFKSFNGGKLPWRILFYRDGVSEGQYHTVLAEEVTQLRAAIEDKYPRNKPPPKMTVVVVGKRHHTRFYVKAGDTENPKAGLVVDTGVTERGTWDFYLQSHTALIGTARPAHYFVVFDEIFAEERAKSDNAATNKLVAVTQALCYTYGRATCPVSYVTPAYFADLACTRARLLYQTDTNLEVAKIEGRGGTMRPWMFYI